MKAICVQQPFAFEIMSGRKTIEIKDWDTLHRGDLLICSARKPALAKDDMEELEEEYGCAFLNGHALCVARLVDIRNSRRGDEEKALVDRIDPEDFSWVLEDARPVVPFPVKEQKGLFEIDDALVSVSPFLFGQPVVVKSGTRAKDFGIDFSGWHGRAWDVHPAEEGEPRIRVMWDSLSLKGIPLSVIEICEKDGFDWTGVLLRFGEIEGCEPRDTWDDVQDAIEGIIEDNPSVFEV